MASDVLSTLPSPTIPAVMPPTVPVKVGEASGAFKASAASWGVETGLLASDVLSTLPKPTIDLLMPPTVPVNVGLAKGALSERALVIEEAYEASLLSAPANSFNVSNAAGAAPTTF